MSLEKELEARSGGVCELCGSSEGLSAMEVAPSNGSIEQSICVCSTCLAQIKNPDSMDENHFNCLNDSMWSEVPAVQVVSYRILNALGRQDLVDGKAVTYGQSLTDACIGWADTEALLAQLSEAVIARRG